MRKSKGYLFWMVLVMICTNNLLVRVVSTTITPTSGTKFIDQKNFINIPDPLVPSGNPGSHGQSNCFTPPTPSSSGGSGGVYPSPSPTPPSHGGGGGYYPSPTPKPPSHGGGSGSGGHHRPPKHTPTNPPSGGGCACPSPPLVSSPPPSSSGGSGSYYPPTPTTPTPVIDTPPSSPLVPSPPIIPLVPSPPFGPRTPLPPYDPTNPPFPCTFWGSHPQLIFGVLGWWATLGGLWGVTTLPGLSSTTSLQQVLTNSRNDGYSSLYREGTAAFLNSMAISTATTTTTKAAFPFSTRQVKDAFLASLDSEKAAASQARVFKLANERKLLKPFATNDP